MNTWLAGDRAAATALSAIVIVLMTLGGGALITDHVALVDQRDTLKEASNAAAIAATLELKQVLTDEPDIGDDDLKAALEPVARGFIIANLQHLSDARLARAKETLVIEVRPNRDRGTVGVIAQADLGGFFFSSTLPFLSAVDRIESVRTEAGVEMATNPVEVVLAIDVSQSMEHRLGGRWDRGPGDSRMEIVKRAAKDLVDILNPDADNRVAIGVVPWHIVVRLDETARQDWDRQDWADYPGSRRYAAPYWCNPADSCTPSAVDQDLPAAPETWNGCLDEHRIVGRRAALPDSEDAFDSPSDAAFAQAFFPAPFGASYQCLRLPLPDDFRQQFCYDGAAPVHQLQTPKPPQHGCVEDMPGILPLISDADAIEAAIDALAPVGLRTYSTLGVAWGQRLLSHAWNDVWGGGTHPVDPDADDNDGTRKAIVLLTDGRDNYCGWFDPQCANGVGLPRATACTAAKAKGTEIFVVAAMHPDQVSGDLAASLRACSSADKDPDGAYVFLNNASAENLEAAFADIANQLVTVRRVY